MTMRSNRLSALVASAVASAIFAGGAVAHADEGDQATQGPPTKPPLRTGWTAGLAVGAVTGTWAS